VRLLLRPSSELPKPSWVSPSNHYGATPGTTYRDEPLHLRPYFRESGSCVCVRVLVMGWPFMCSLGLSRMLAMKRSCSHTFPVGSSKSGCQCRFPATEKVMGRLYCFLHARILRRTIERQRRARSSIVGGSTAGGSNVMRVDDPGSGKP
jgi:hypothetical protein